MSDSATRVSKAQQRREQRRRAQKAAARRRLLGWIAAGVVLLAVVVLVAVLTTGGAVPGPDLEEVAGSPEITGDALAGAPEDPTQDPEIGSRAPVATGEDFDGDAVVVGEGAQAELIMFMASWCPACQQELPEVVAWLEEGRLPDGVRLVSVATRHDPTAGNWPPQDWFEREGFDGPVLVDDAESSVATAYGLRATPYWVALDADGEVVARISGMIGADELDVLADAVG